MIRNIFRTKSAEEVAAEPGSPGGLTTSRLEAFSDGVFAIAITILVLTIEVPKVSEVHSAEDLLNRVLELGPRFLTYLVSFVVVGTYWVAHSATFHYIKRTDRPLFWFNLTYLLFVSFIPFPTALLGNFYQYQLSAVIYAAMQVVAGVLFQTMVWYAAATGLLTGKVDRAFMRAAAVRNLTGPALYFVAILVSFVSLPVCWGLFVIIPILYILPGRIDRDWRRISPAHHADHPAESANPKSKI